MNTARLNLRKVDFEKLMITLGMAFMEIFGAITLFCGIMDIKIF